MFWERRETVEREGERREEEEEDGGAKIKANKVWNFGFLYGTLDFWYGNYFGYGFCMDHMEF